MTEPAQDYGRECGSSILHCFKRCTALLDEHIASPSNVVRQNSRHALQALDTWAEFTGTLAPPEKSLDRRLEDGSDLKEAIHDQFHVIQAELAHPLSESGSEVKPILSLRSHPLDVPGTDATQEEWKPYQETPWEAISLVMDVLMDIAFVIRINAPFPISHFDQNYPCNDDISLFHMMETLIRQRWPDARETLRDQLAYSTHIRRRRLLYQKAQEGKFAKSKEADEEIVKDTPKPNQTPIDVQTRQELVAPLLMEMISDVPLHTRKASASTTFSNERNSNLYARRPPRSTTGSTQPTAARHHGIHEYPSQPKLDQAWVRCPICYRPLPSDSFSSDGTQRYWKEHVDEDIEPFVCLSERCRDPPRFFSRKDKWLDHMQSFHGQDWTRTIHSVTWYCDRNHELENFDTKNELCEHLKSKHPELNKHRVRALSTINKRPLEREALRCPICEQIPKEVLQESSNMGKSVAILMDHIEQHLIWLALFALPIDEPQSGNEPPHFHLVKSSATTADMSSIAKLTDTFGAHRPPVYVPTENAGIASFERAGTLESDSSSEASMPLAQVDPLKKDSDAAWDTYWNGDRSITENFTRTDLVLQSLQQAKSNIHGGPKM